MIAILPVADAMGKKKFGKEAGNQTIHERFVRPVEAHDFVAEPEEEQELCLRGMRIDVGWLR